MIKTNMIPNGRTKANRAQIWGAIAEWLTAATAIIGIFFLLHQNNAALRDENMHNTEVKHHDAEEAIARLYALDANVNQALSETGNVRKSLSEDPEGAVYGRLSDDEKSVFEDASASLADVFEYYLLIRHDILKQPERGKEIADSWDRCMRVTCNNSYGFRGYIKKNREMWTKTFQEQFDKYCPPEPSARLASPRPERRS